MLAAVRQAMIVDEVRRTGAARISDLTSLLRVSDVTVRRDLEVLDRRGLLTRVRGGATNTEMDVAIELDFEDKSRREPDEKRAVAEVAVSLIRPGMAIALSSGSTTFAVASALGDIPHLTVVTNSLKVADLLYLRGRPDQTVVLLGGLRTPSGGLVGPVAVQAIRSLHVDLTFMGVHGMDEHAGLTTPNMLEAETNRAMVDTARRLVVVTDHTKWGVVGLSQIAPLSAVSTIVTGEQIAAEAVSVLRDHVGEVLLARAASPVVASENGFVG